MGLFDQPFAEIRSLLQHPEIEQKSTVTPAAKKPAWPSAGDSGFVFKEETGIELGSPRKQSVSFLIWSEDPALISENRITVIGPQLAAMTSQQLDFGQMILLGVHPPEIDDNARLYQTLEEIKYRVDLQGFMRRGVSRFFREWSRISRDALAKGFSLQTLGQALIHQFLQAEAVKTVEVILTCDPEIIEKFSSPAAKVIRIIEAMHKMLEEDLMDCNQCDYSDLCKEVEELKKIRAQKLRTSRIQP